MQKNISKTLCSKAWTDLNVSFANKSVQHCCKSKRTLFPKELTVDFFNNDSTIVKRRQDLLNGIENTQCQSCWDSYKEFGTSYREHTNLWKSVADVSDQLQHIEIMLDNLCDMSCIYCSEESSHKIAQEKGLLYKMKKPDTDKYEIFLDWLSTLDYEYNLSFLGGELTYSKNFYNFLQMLLNDKRFHDKKIYLSLMTNGNTNKDQLDKFFELYNLIPDKWNFIMVFSNESMHELSELVRWGLDWHLYEKNFNYYLSYDKIKTIGLCPTLNLFTINSFYNYLEWAFDSVRKQNKKLIVFGNWVGDVNNILHPAYSKNVEVIPKIKNLIMKNKDLFDNTKWYNDCLVWIDEMSKILNTKTLSEEKLNDFLQSMAKQKQSSRVFRLVDFI